jgi:hypothetical protein
LHNALQPSGGILAIDIKVTLNTIFQYIPTYTYTVRVEELNESCDFVDGEYKQILRSVKSRRLSLQPAMTRVISKFSALK